MKDYGKIKSYNKDLITSIVLRCPHCSTAVDITDFHAGVVKTKCQSEHCGAEWRVIINIEEI